MHHVAVSREDKDAEGPRILLTGEVALIDEAIAEAEAANLVRDMVNTPAEDMGPEAIEAQVTAIAKAFDAEVSVTRGDALEKEFPMVHAVGTSLPQGVAVHIGRAEQAVRTGSVATAIRHLESGLAAGSGSLGVEEQTRSAYAKLI